jgi:hypothetical protein
MCGVKSERVRERAYAGTAGLMFDFSSVVSSFSRIVLSELTMRRVAITDDADVGLDNW